MLRALNDDLVNAKAIHPFVKFILMHQQIAIVDERRILVGNHPHGPTAFPRVSWISSADQDLRRCHALVRCTERKCFLISRVNSGSSLLMILFIKRVPPRLSNSVAIFSAARLSSRQRAVSASRIPLRRGARSEMTQ